MTRQMMYTHKDMPVFIYRKTNKHMYVRMRNTGCHISVPKQLSYQLIQQYVTENEQRLLLIYQKLHDIQYTLLGRAIKIKYKKSEFHYETNDDILTIAHPISFDDGFKIFLKLEFQKYLELIQPEIHEHIIKHGLKPVKIELKYLQSKYGSYHRLKNKMTLNSFLYMLDPQLIHYVIMHEYAHTKEFHHQKSFYDLQHQLCANDKELSKRLKTLTIPTHFTL